MNQLATRGIISYCGFSAGIFLLDGYMRASGFASSYNPAWGLIHLIYLGLAMTWKIGLITSAGVIAFLCISWAVNLFNDIRIKKIEKVARIKSEQEAEISNEIRRRDQRRTQILARRQKLKKESEVKRKREAYREYLRSRTPAEAIDDAFNQIRKGRR